MSRRRTPVRRRRAVRRAEQQQRALILLVLIVGGLLIALGVKCYRIYQAHKHLIDTIVTWSLPVLGILLVALSALLIRRWRARRPVVGQTYAHAQFLKLRNRRGLEVLYRHYQLPGANPLYIGISNDYERRCGQHAASKRWWELVDLSLSTVTVYPTRDAVARAEIAAIKREKPTFNDQHNTPLGVRQ